MSTLKVAVVGGGNGSYTMAADMALAGHEVRMCPGPRERHQEVWESRSIRISGLGRTGEGRLVAVSDDLREVVVGADLVFCSDPAPSQPTRAKTLAPHLEAGQVVFLSPGSLGSYLCAKIVREEGGSQEVAFVEPGTLPYLTRKTGPAEVQVSGRAAHLPVGVFPARETARALERVRRVYPAAHPVENALSVALLNVGPILHSVLVLLNTGPIEHLASWDIHNEGTSPSVKKLILAHDAERIRVRTALGFAPPHYPMRDHYDPSGDAEWMYGRKAHVDLVKSEKWREKLSFSHRYVVEDVRCNLALQSSVGRLARVETPIADALLTLIGTIVGEEFRQTGRSRASLGLGDLSLPELTRLLDRGFRA
ncbi:MAG: NAD/NADP octopine/nopaline dehydrogenase family protein [Deltaproteobacteria bacterium]|nr:NAD/NADP octopine/nopaline dehydrogenase family protein [Deltaproteobacteria bacterium]